MSDVIWRRLKYMLSPQLDLYTNISPLTKGKNVLEVGFGTGFGTLQFASYAVQIDALESNEDAVKFARDTIDLPNINWIHSDILEYQYLVKYDLAVMVEVLEHIHDWSAALDKVDSMLRPRGKLIITARNLNADLRRNELHEREWTALEFKENLLRFFSEVQLYDHALNPVGEDTHITPLIAIAIKGEKDP